MNRKHKSNAFDTETIKGYARLICTPYKSAFVYSFDEIINLLMSQGSNYGRQFFTFNITFDGQSILKYLPTDILLTLHKEHEAIYNEYTIKYIKGKFLKIRETGTPHSISIYDIAQFYKGSLDYNAKFFLNDKKEENTIISNIKTHQNDWTQNQMEDYFIKNKEILISYCKHDAFLTAALADLMKKKVKKLFGITLQSFSSRAKIGEVLTQEYEKYPKFDENSMAGKYARASYGGGLFDLWQRGEFGIVTDLDISSAYPFHQSKLPHWANGEFKHITKEPELNNYKYGWILCEFDCFYIPYKKNEYESWEEKRKNEDITFTIKHQKVYYPTGKRVKIVTLLEYNFMKEYNFYVNFIDGYVWKQTSNEYKKPFAWMESVYNIKKDLVISCGSKKEAKKDYAYPLSKIALNGTYGKTVQEVGQARMKNFFYGSYITASTRIQVARFIEDNHLRHRVILIATDGLLISGKAPELDYHTGLGEWEKDEYNAALVIANGIYQLYNKDGTFDTKMRGYHIKNDFDLKTFIQHHDNLYKVLIPSAPSPVTLFQGIGYKNIYTKEDINVFEFRQRYLKTDSNLTKKWIGLNKLGDFLGKQYSAIRYTVKELEEDENGKSKKTEMS